LEGDESGLCAAGPGTMGKRKSKRFESAEGVDDYWRLRSLWEVNVSPDAAVDAAAAAVDDGDDVGVVGVVDGYCCHNLGGGGCVSCCCCCCCCYCH